MTKRQRDDRPEWVIAAMAVLGLTGVLILMMGGHTLLKETGSSPSTTVTTGTTTATTTTTTTMNEWAAAMALPYYVADHADRYAAYRDLSPDLTPKSVIVAVNMNLDRAFYTDPIAIQHPDDPLVLCNKYYYLSSAYVPSDLVSVAVEHTRGGATLRKEANDAYALMCEAAKQDGIELRITTAYRSYSFQSTLYNNYVASDGVDEADTYSARPGFSEHQTGLAMDLGGPTPSGGLALEYFEGTPAFDWMQAHAAEYGFILRFPEDKVHITGYQYEAWHYRYVGVEAARVIWDEHLCLEEYWAMYLTGQIN